MPPDSAQPERSWRAPPPRRRPERPALRRASLCCGPCRAAGRQAEAIPCQTGGLLKQSPTGTAGSSVGWQARPPGSPPHGQACPLPALPGSPSAPGLPAASPPACNPFPLHPLPPAPPPQCNPSRRHPLQPRTCSLADAQPLCCSARPAAPRCRRRWPAPRPANRGGPSAPRAAAPASLAGGRADRGQQAWHRQQMRQIEGSRQVCSGSRCRMQDQQQVGVHQHLHACTKQACEAPRGRCGTSAVRPAGSEQACRPTCAAAPSRCSWASSSRASQALWFAGSSAGPTSMLSMSSKVLQPGRGGGDGASAGMPGTVRVQSFVVVVLDNLT